jgi:hypothetical protein
MPEMTREECIFELECAMQLALEKGFKYAYQMLENRLFILKNPGAVSFTDFPIKPREL